MVDHTPVQFGSSALARTAPMRARARRARTICPRCAELFSADGRFCPFDGEPLRAAPEWDPASDPLLGTVVDNRYEVLSVLGEGGMGIVYEARHRALGKRFALKALRKDFASDREIAARFIQEARTAARVSHPGLVEITDFGQLATGQPFFVMELLEGQSLTELIRCGGAIPVVRAVCIIRQLAEALSAAHELSIVHRDLKPDNIHISPGGQGRERVTIVDFGLAKVMGASRLTRQGMVFGTPHYMSPEQAMGEPTDHRADIYALGIVMYEMFTGRVPFEADSYMGVLTKHMYMAPIPPSQLPGTEQLGALEHITLRCLAKKPEQRYASVRELLSDLDAVRSGEDDASAVRRRRVTPRSILADELELPNHDELGGKRETSRERSWSIGPVLLCVALSLAGMVSVILWRSVSASEPNARRAALPSAPSHAATAAGTTPAAVAAVPVPVVSEPSPVAPATESATSATEAPPASVTSAATARSRSTRAAAPSAKPRSSGRTGPSAGPRQTAAQLGGTEIVDPWAK